MRKTCDNCARRFVGKENAEGCKTFIEKPKKCWAWTSDPDWLRKINEEIKGYGR